MLRVLPLLVPSQSTRNLLLVVCSALPNCRLHTRNNPKSICAFHARYRLSTCTADQHHRELEASMPAPHLRRQTATIALYRYRPIAKGQRRLGSTPHVGGVVCIRPSGRGSGSGCSSSQPIAVRWFPAPARLVALPGPVHHPDPPSHPPPPIAAGLGGTLAPARDPTPCTRSRHPNQAPVGLESSLRARVTRRPNERRQLRGLAERLSAPH